MNGTDNIHYTIAGTVVVSTACMVNMVLSVILLIT
jgi:hypothetical protein